MNTLPAGYVILADCVYVTHEITQETAKQICNYYHCEIGNAVHRSIIDKYAS
jgi:hypothetical protein